MFSALTCCLLWPWRAHESTSFRALKYLPSFECFESAKTVPFWWQLDNLITQYSVHWFHLLVVKWVRQPWCRVDRPYFLPGLNGTHFCPCISNPRMGSISDMLPHPLQHLLTDWLPHAVSCFLSQLTFVAS